jgi:monoamine oxidase
MRTPLFLALRRLVRDISTDAPAPASGETAHRRGVSRRTFVGGSLAAGAGVALAGVAPPAAAGANPPRIVIIGAGLAGLTAAYRLRQAGYGATVYEASGRLGGRCFSNRNWAAGQVSEHGGELIDTGHVEIRELATELGLTLENRVDATPPGTDTFFWFNGHRYPAEVVRNDLRAILPQAQSDAEAAGFPILYNDFTPRARELDLMSIRDWIQRYVPGGMTSRVGELLDVAYTIEYGAETSRQSSLNLINLFGYSTSEDPELFGESDEVYHVAGGNDQIVSRLAARLPGQIVTNTVLTALSRGGDGRFTVRLSSGSAQTSVVADRLLLALPFTRLRRVDLSQAGFPARKRRAIEQLPMGQNTKLVLQFNRRRWYDIGCDGSSFSDTGYQDTWETTLGQSGTPGILTNFTGGAVALDFASQTPDFYARRFLRQVEPVLPPVPPTWNGRVSLEYWPGYVWTLGSYAYYGVGDYTTIAGVEREAVGTCHFAGEHTSIESQGFLNGAVESGERAAGEIVDALS